MDSKELRLFREAYGSIYEGYGKKKEGDCVDKEDKGEHNCAKKVCHESFGEGTCIFGEHAVPDENGFVSHYDVMFEHGIERNVPVADMEVLEEKRHPTSEGHEGMYDGEQIDEGEIRQQQQLSDYKRRAQEAAAAAARQKEREARGMKAGPNPKPETQLNSADLFDIVKGHLMSEGYADTEEAALAIMANMSEEWRRSIIEDNSTGKTITIGGQTFRDYSSDGLSDRQKRMKEFGDKRTLNLNVGLPVKGV